MKSNLERRPLVVVHRASDDDGDEVNQVKRSSSLSKARWSATHGTKCTLCDYSRRVLRPGSREREYRAATWTRCDPREIRIRIAISLMPFRSQWQLWVRFAFTVRVSVNTSIHKPQSRSPPRPTPLNTRGFRQDLAFPVGKQPYLSSICIFLAPSKLQTAKLQTELELIQR